MKTGVAFVADDVVPPFRGQNIDIGLLKTLTVLNNELWFDNVWIDDLKKVNPDDLAGGSVDSILKYRRPLDELESLVELEAPRRAKDVRKFWKALPPSVNTTDAQSVDTG